MGPMFWFAYKVGALVLGMPPQAEQFAISWEWLSSGLLAIWQPFLLGCLICGFFFASLGFFTINLLWRWQVVQRWEARRDRRRQALELTTRAVALRQAAIRRRDAQDTKPQENKDPEPPR